MTELSCRWAAGPFLARFLLALGILLALLVAPGCGQGQAASRPEEGSARDWPFSVVSTEPRFRVFYDSPADRGTAEHVASSLRDAWVFQTRVLGFTNPPSDGGIVGPDDWFDVFLVRGIDSCKVDIASPEPVTPWGGLACYMQLDPWGKYGGEGLAQTVAHEFNHATQAADAWNDMPIVYEMTACYVDQYFGGPIGYQLADFQAHPEWSLLRNDDYATYYMYGSSLYLHFLRDCYFGGDDRFISLLWKGMRRRPGVDPARPLFVDALNAALAPQGKSFLDTVPTFARWRYYTYSRDDHRHFQRVTPALATRPQTFLPDETSLPESDLVLRQVSLQETPLSIEPAPMRTGSAYRQVVRENPSQTSFQVRLIQPPGPASEKVRWVVQAVPGLSPDSDGEVVEFTRGVARVPFAPDGRRTLILTAMPTSDYDPAFPSDETFPVSLQLEP